MHEWSRSMSRRRSTERQCDRCHQYVDHNKGGANSSVGWLCNLCSFSSPIEAIETPIEPNLRHALEEIERLKTELFGWQMAYRSLKGRVERLENLANEGMYSGNTFPQYR